MSEAVQRWDPQQYAANARFVSDLGLPVVELPAPRPGERILDLGRGDGALTAQLAAMGCEVVGVDASPEMVAAACALALDARVMSGEALTFVAELATPSALTEVADNGSGSTIMFLGVIGVIIAVYLVFRRLRVKPAH